jgi:hypothetical protein
LRGTQVLDVGSLHWSQPETTGRLAPARAHHSVCFQPTRIQALPVLDDAAPSGGGESSPPPGLPTGELGYRGRRGAVG